MRKYKKHNYTIGDIVGNLTVLSDRILSSSKKDSFYKCKCSCGELRTVRADKLDPEKINGCYKCCTFRFKYSVSETSYWRKRFDSIKDRCYNPKSKSFVLYGKNGITICKEWLENPNLFCKWCEETCPDKSLTLDRIDNSKGYEPSNLRWATIQEQALNLRNNIILPSGIKRAVFWKDYTGDKCSYSCFRSRLIRGWTPEKAIFPITE